MAPNAFAYVPSLYAFALDAARRLASGKDVLALTGPYEPDDFVGQVRALLPGQAFSESVVESSQAINVRDARGLVVVRRLEQSVDSLSQECAGVGVEFLMAPTGISRDELSSYGNSLMAHATSETFRSFVLRLASCSCGGSVECYRYVVEQYAAREGKAPKNPLDVLDAFGRARARRICENNTHDVEAIVAFAQFLLQVASGVPIYGADARDMYLWAWSAGLCTRLDGVWCPDWGVLLHCLDNRFDGLEDAAFVLNQVRLRRVCAAECSSMMPVIEAYCSYAMARYDAAGHLAGEDWFDHPNCNRASQVSDVARMSFKHESIWNSRVGGSVKVDNLRELRNRICHSEAVKVNAAMLSDFGSALIALAELERDSYSPGRVAVFM